ncbi:polysaccharide biosynthesis protein [Candidatus Sumerlaeota bacterium]|nr:polysaccharide biosynthesis protein [Candidatus Sumerlaeota bacterium]
MNGSQAIKTSFYVTIFVFLETVLGFIFQVLLAKWFGTTSDMDAYLAAATVPTIITMVFFGTLNVTFIPVFIEYQTRRNEREAWRIASYTLIDTALILALFSVAGIIFSQPLLKAIVPGLSPSQIILATKISQILFISIVLSGSGHLLSSIYFARHKTSIPPLLAMIQRGVQLGLLFVLFPSLGIFAVPWSFLGSWVFYFMALAPIILRPGRFYLGLGLSNSGVRKIATLMAPLILASFFYRAYPAVDRYFASNFGEGSIAALGYAKRILQVMSKLLVFGPVMTVFPIFSEHAAKDDMNRLADSLAKSLRMMIFILLPACLLLGFLSLPLVRLLFERGKFTYESSLITSKILAYYAIALFFLVINDFNMKLLYSLEKTKLIAVINISGIFFHLIATFTLSLLFGLYGIAIAYSLSCAIVTMYCIHTINNKIGLIKRLQIKRIAREFLLASTVLIIAIFLFSYLGSSIKISVQLVDFSKNLFIPALAAIVAYLTTLFFLRNKEFFVLLKKTKIGRKLSDSLPDTPPKEM